MPNRAVLLPASATSLAISFAAVAAVSAAALTSLPSVRAIGLPSPTFAVSGRVPPAVSVPLSASPSSATTRRSSSSKRERCASLAMSSEGEASGAGPDGGGGSSSSRVVVVGSANQDLTAYTAQVPTTGETVMGQTFETCCGGKGANQAVAAASLGICPVTMVCRVGPDSFGTALLSNFRKVGVEYDESSTVLPKGSTTGVAPIVVDTKTGDNMIIVVPGANHELSPSDVRSSILDVAASNGGTPPSAVVVQLEIKPEAALEALKAGREVGATTILNPAPAPEGWTLDDEFYRYADIVIPNESELRRLCGEEVVEGAEANDEEEERMARELFDRGVARAVIVTLGARGAMVVSKDGEGEVARKVVSAPPGLPCESMPVVDTVGAGDSFCGALSAYLSAGLDLADAAMKACGVASMSVRKRGAQSSYPTAEELPDELRVEGAAAAAAASGKPAISFVTGNKKKLEEVQRILATGEGELPFEITSHKVDLPELQGDPVEIAKEKCRLAAKEVGGPVLTEDTSLCFTALNGLPGPYIKWFLEKCGHDGLNDMLTGFEDKSAYAQTVVAFSIGPDEEVHVFDGRTNGKIVRPRGSLDFGWDPVFEPDEGGGKTYAEMEKDEKNAISHRGRSFAKIHDFLVAEGESIKKKLV